MDERVALATTPQSLALAGRLLHEFNTAYDDSSPGPGALAARLAGLVAAGATDVLVAEEAGVCVLQYRPSLWSDADEAYLAELWVDPAARRRGLGRALLRAGLERARDRGCDYLGLATTEEDVEARRLYESEGLHATEGIDGPTAYHYEIDL
ncbi:GNAT family N-acetyltransferase [uncultured Phycicoccus sp.]|uniref:GNAT family N-acetyltransferase n=1 Tax=uncultured Phycicoccus sp. TaxID=661422 RepID=UPI0026241DA9|nr:GNAT family N-acetyltransferase [uncultured Phycicoccus sp.]